MGHENQHWVARFLIRHFTDGGRVYCLDIHTDEITRPAPKYAASERGFNDFHVDGKSISFEGKLQKIETKAAPVIKRIIERRSLVGLSAVDDIFYLRDNPVVLQRTRNPSDGSNLGFDVEGVEAFLPLSPKCALYMPCRATSREIIERYEAAIALHHAVRLAVFRGTLGGGIELRAAQTTISRSYHLYKAFTVGSALIAERANVENLNSRQCGWSYRAVYSNRKDFTFARMVFQKTPQYRGAPRTSVIEIGRILVPPAE